MEFLKLAAVFGVIVAMLSVRRPLYQAVLAGLLAAAVLYGLGIGTMASCAMRVFTEESDLAVLLSLYLITLLQRILEARGQLRLAQQDLDRLFHNRRVNALGAPLFIGLLPSAAAMLLCAGIVKDASDGYLPPKQQAFVTTWFRHIPESTLPTYAGVLLMAGLSGVPLPSFMAGMAAPMTMLAFLGYWPYLRKLPRDPGTAVSRDRMRDGFRLLWHTWPLLFILVLILGFGFGVVEAILCAVAASAAAHRVRADELIHLTRSAVEKVLLLNTFLVLVLKECIGEVRVLEALPAALGQLPLPEWTVFALLFFLGSIVAGTVGVIAMGTPLAFSVYPGDMPLMVLLMGMCHAASQISPIHVCLVVASDFYHVPLGTLIRQTVPFSLLFCLLMVLYYLALKAAGL